MPAVTACHNRRMIPAGSDPLYSAAQVRQVDAAAVAAGIPETRLMQRAAQAAWDCLQRRWPQARRLVLLCGSGHNGGDGYLLGARALEAGLQVHCIAAAKPLDGAGWAALDAFRAAGGQAVQLRPGAAVPEADLVVDALLGVGLTRAPEGALAALIERVNASGLPVLALDVPTGLDADTGHCPGPCIRACATISFIGWKRGLFTASGPDMAGERELDGLQLEEPSPAVATAWLLPQRVALPTPRRQDSHKLQFGHVLAIGGDHGMAGAIRLCGEAALRCGAGVVSLATRSAHLPAIQAARPELMAHGVEGVDALTPLLERASHVVAGPGLGQGAWGRMLLGAALRAGKPLVLDADALNLLAADPVGLPSGSVLTPHPGEAARLLGTSSAGVQRDRFLAASSLARRHQAVVILKGAGSLVAEPHGALGLCRFGNPGMASAGMGDVLTGVVAALLAQGLPAWQAACSAVVVHARAGDGAAGGAPRGLLAGDLAPVLRTLVNA